MFGSARRWRKPWKGLIAASWIGAPARSRTTSRPPTWIVRPVAYATTSSIVAASPSTAPTAAASVAGDDFASATVPTAHATGR